jgi:hypothetical protein
MDRRALVAFADRHMLVERARQLGLDVELQTYYSRMPAQTHTSPECCPWSTSRSPAMRAPGTLEPRQLAGRRRGAAARDRAVHAR